MVPNLLMMTIKRGRGREVRALMKGGLVSDEKAVGFAPALHTIIISYVKLLFPLIFEKDGKTVERPAVYVI